MQEGGSYSQNHTLALIFVSSSYHRWIVSCYYCESQKPRPSWSIATLEGPCPTQLLQGGKYCTAILSDTTATSHMWLLHIWNAIWWDWEPQISSSFFFFCNPSLYYRKANSFQDSWEGGEEPPLSIVLRGFYPLKMGGTNVGSRKIWFSPIGLAQLPISVLIQLGL